MNDEFNRYFASRLDQFKAHGAGIFRDEVPELLRRAGLPDASKSFLHFVADVCIELKNYSCAVELLRLIDAKFILDDIGYNIMAFCYWEMNLEAAAYNCYKRSLELDPNNVSSLRGACFLAIETDHDEEAVEYCRKATQLSPSNRELAIWFATALSNAGSVEELKEFIGKREIQFGRDEELDQKMNKLPEGGGYQVNSIGRGNYRLFTATLKLGIQSALMGKFGERPKGRR